MADALLERLQGLRTKEDRETDPVLNRLQSLRADGDKEDDPFLSGLRSLKPTSFPAIPKERMLLPEGLKLTPEQQAETEAVRSQRVQEIERTRKEQEAASARYEATFGPVDPSKKMSFELKNTMKRVGQIGGALTAPLRGFAVELHRAQLKAKGYTEEMLSDMPRGRDLFDLEMLSAPPSASEIEMMGLKGPDLATWEEIQRTRGETTAGRVGTFIRDMQFEFSIDPLTYVDLWRLGMRVAPHKELLKTEKASGEMKRALQRESVWGLDLHDATVQRIASRNPEVWKRISGQDPAWRRVFLAADLRKEAAQSSVRRGLTVLRQAEEGMKADEAARLGNLEAAKVHAAELEKAAKAAEEVRVAEEKTALAFAEKTGRRAKVEGLRKPEVSLKEQRGIRRLQQVENAMKLDEEARIAEEEVIKIHAVDVMNDELRRTQQALEEATKRSASEKLEIEAAQEYARQVSLGRTYEPTTLTTEQVAQIAIRERTYGPRSALELENFLLRNPEQIESVVTESQIAGGLRTRSEIAAERAAKTAREEAKVVTPLVKEPTKISLPVVSKAKPKVSEIAVPWEPTAVKGEEGWRVYRKSLKGKESGLVKAQQLSVANPQLKWRVRPKDPSNLKGRSVIEFADPKALVEAPLEPKEVVEVARALSNKLKTTTRELGQEAKKIFRSAEGDIQDTASIGATQSTANEFVLINNEFNAATRKAERLKKIRRAQARDARRQVKLTARQVVESAEKRGELAMDDLRAAERLGILDEGYTATTLPFSKTTYSEGYLGYSRALSASTERRAQQSSAGFEMASRLRRLQAMEDMGNAVVGSIEKQFRKYIRSKEDEIAFIARIQGKDSPVRVKSQENIDKAVALWEVVRTTVRNSGERAGLDIGFIEKYWPRYYPDKVIDNEAWINQAVKKMLASGEAKSVSEAKRIINFMKKEQKGRPAGHLEKARRTDLPGYIEDDFFNVFGRYMHGANRRIYQAKLFGKEDEIYHQLVRLAEQQNGTAHRELLQEWADIQMGRRTIAEIDPVWSKPRLTNALRNVRGFTTGIALGVKTILLQPTQTVSTAAYGGVIRTIGQLLLHPVENVRAVRELGMVLEHVGHPLLMETADTSRRLVLGERFAKALPELKAISWVDRYVRGAAMVVGRDKADDLLQIAKQGGDRGKEALRRLREAGVDITKAMDQGLDDVERNIFARDFSRVTNVEAGIGDLPTWWRYDIMKTLLQFKSFLYGAQRGAKRIILDELKTGGPMAMTRSILTYLVGGDAVGGAVLEMRYGLSGKKRKYSPDEIMWHVENIATVGTLGAYELIRSVTEYALEPPAMSKVRLIGKRILKGDITGAFGEVFPILKPHLPGEVKRP